jgi:hypothetical protein
MAGAVGFASRLGSGLRIIWDEGLRAADDAAS